MPTMETVGTDRAIWHGYVACNPGGPPGDGDVTLDVPILLPVSVLPNAVYPVVDVLVTPLDPNGVDWYVEPMVVAADGHITIHLRNATVNAAPGAQGLFRVVVKKEQV